MDCEWEPSKSPNLLDCLVQPVDEGGAACAIGEVDVCTQISEVSHHFDGVSGDRWSRTPCEVEVRSLGSQAACWLMSLNTWAMAARQTNGSGSGVYGCGWWRCVSRVHRGACRSLGTIDGGGSGVHGSD